MWAALLQHQFHLIILTLHYIKRNGRQRIRRKRRRMGQVHFCRHLDTSGSSLEMKVLGQSTVEERCSSHVTRRVTYIMHTLLVRLHTMINNTLTGRPKVSYVIHKFDHTLQCDCTLRNIYRYVQRFENKRYCKEIMSCNLYIGDIFGSIKLIHLY